MNIMYTMFGPNRPALFLAALIIVVGAPTMFEWVRAWPAMAASPLYWCPNEKADQRSSSNPSPGCVPSLAKTDRAEHPQHEDAASSKPAAREVKMENLQSEVANFLQKYRRFLDCCKTDFAELQQVEALGDEVSGLLES